MKNKYLLGLVIGVIILISSMALNIILGMIMPSLNSEYINPAFRPWADPIMSLFYLYPIVLGIGLTYFWLKTKKSWKNGLEFGLTYGVINAVTAFIINFSSFTFSIGMVGSWTVMGLINAVVAGLALEKLDD